MLRILEIAFLITVWWPEAAVSDPARAGEKMTVTRLNDLIEAVGDKVSQPTKTQWRFLIEDVPVFVVADALANRMRILVGITKASELPAGLLRRLMQANFDTTLDARYAIARDTIWAAYLHPLESLGDAEFLSGLGQTVNLARTFGTTFSSGGVAYNGGDSSGIIERELIEKLLEKGLAI